MPACRTPRSTTPAAPADRPWPGCPPRCAPPGPAAPCAGSVCHRRSVPMCSRGNACRPAVSASGTDGRGRRAHSTPPASNERPRRRAVPSRLSEVWRVPSCCPPGVVGCQSNITLTLYHNESQLSSPFEGETPSNLQLIHRTPCCAQFLTGARRAEENG